MKRGIPMSETILKINIHELIEVQITCEKCPTSIICTPEALIETNLVCPRCGHHGKNRINEKLINDFASGLLGLTGKGSTIKAPKIEFILKETKA